MSTELKSDLPANWSLSPLGEAITPTRPRVKPAEKPDLPFIGMEHIEAHTMSLLGTVPAGTMKSSAVHFQPGDVLYGRLRPYLNKVYRPDFEGLCSAEFIVFPKSENIESKYLQYFLNSWEFVSFASHLNEGDRPRVDFKQLSPYPFPLPPPDQQTRIVAEIEKQFSRLDEAVANLKRVKANLKRYKAAVLKAAVEGKLTEEWRKNNSDVEPADKLLERILAERRANWKGRGKYKEPDAPNTTGLPELPVGWVWAKFDQITERVTKGSSPNWQGFEYCDQGIPFVRSQNVGWGTTDFSEVAFLPLGFNQVEKKSVLCEGDVLLNIVGASIGRAAIAPKAVEGGNVNQAVAVIRLEPYGVDNQFALLYLLSYQAQRRIHSGKVDVARANFSLEDIKEMPVPLPPLFEQHQIVAEVERRLSIVTKANVQVDSNLRRAECLRQSVLKKAFSGGL